MAQIEALLRRGGAVFNGLFLIRIAPSGEAEDQRNNGNDSY
jgi:hypothetical protein